MPKLNEVEVQTSSRMTLKEFFVLMGVNLLVSLRNLVEFVKVAFKYYGNVKFMKEDLSLRLMYFFHNPYRMNKRFLMMRGEKEIYTYGETPLTTLDFIAHEAQIGPQDRVIELGSGRGRNCFWLHSIIGCEVVGIEYVPEFVERANRIKERLGVSGVEFLLGDFMNPKGGFPVGTIYYLYGSCLSDSDIEKLAERLAKLPRGTKIITVSYPLTEYILKPSFEVINHFTAPFTWGEADVYIQVTT